MSTWSKLMMVLATPVQKAYTSRPIDFARECFFAFLVCAIYGKGYHAYLRAVIRRCASEMKVLNMPVKNA